jgi:hypothetical protein
MINADDIHILITASTLGLLTSSRVGVHTSEVCLPSVRGLGPSQRCKRLHSLRQQRRHHAVVERGEPSSEDWLNA